MLIYFRKAISFFAVVAMVLGIIQTNVLAADVAKQVTSDFNSATIIFSIDGATISKVDLSLVGDETDGDISPSGSEVRITNLKSNTSYEYRAHIEYTNTDDTEETKYTETTTGIFKTKATASLTIDSVDVQTDSSGNTATVTAKFTAVECSALSTSEIRVNDSSVTITDKKIEANNTMTAKLSNLKEGQTIQVTAEIKYSDNQVEKSQAMQKSYTHPYKTESPTVTVNTPTFTISSSKANILFTGTVTKAGSQTVTDAGFLYSLTNKTPTIGGSNVTKFSTTSNIASGVTNRTISGSKTGFSLNQTLYVRAYAINSVGTSYSSDVKQIYLSTTPEVVTGSYSDLSDDGARVTIDVKSTGNGISQKGVIVSTSTSRLSNSYVSSDQAKKFSSSSTTTGTSTILVSGLESETTYYYKAYIISEGTYYYDSSYKSFKTSSDDSKPKVTTGSISYVSDTSADVTINVTSKGDSNITERGVVYSTTASSPTISDSKKASSTSSVGSTTISLTGLSRNRDYYVRAYARNSYGVAYGAVKSFTTSSSSSSSKINVTTTSVDNIMAETAEVSINVTESSSSNIITERGVVYSSYDETPVVGNSRTFEQTAFGITGRTTVMIRELDSGTKYYVRAYAKDSKDYTYGEVLTLTTRSSDSTPSVETVSAYIESDKSIDVVINVIDDNGSDITERGVVYSSSSDYPKKGDSYCYTEKASKSDTGRTTVTIENISTDIYYVRAYATNKNGTSYGQVYQVIFDDVIQTNDASSIATNSVVIGGYVSQNINSSVIERGIVYSTTNTTPTIQNSSKESDTTAYGNFSISLTNLAVNTKYYARAYIKTSHGYLYGDTVNFTTQSKLELKIQYILSDGTSVGSQTIDAAKNQTITSDWLILPLGYYLSSSNFSYLAIESETVYVTVRTSNAEYMEGTSNYKFEPDRKATRIEVAKMIYALRGKPSVQSSKTYTDIASNYSEKAAIDYVSSMNFMTGYPDGSFRPNNSITRGEVAVICTTVYGISLSDEPCKFKDSTSHWSAKYITAASEYGAIAGYLDGTFRPNNNITKAEICSLFSNAEKRDLTPLGTQNFTDVPTTHWAYNFIMNAAIPKP